MGRFFGRKRSRDADCEHPSHQKRRARLGEGWEELWGLAHGIHRKVILLGAATGAIGWMIGQLAPAWAVVVIPVILGPLSWWTTWKIARPLRELARVAHELQAGRLDRRTAIPTATGEVGEVADALRSVSDRLAQQLADQRALMAAVSHELRSPLGRARVLVEMAQEGSAPETVYADLEGEILAMDALVGDLLAAARIDFEAVNPVPLDPVDVARRALEIARLPPGTLTIAGSPPPRLRADATLLARALSGLLENARRYGQHEVGLTLSTDGGSLAFVVDDRGPGFAPGQEEQAFQPFWRAPGAAPGGQGLGLALVRQIARAHGGTADAANRPGGGARVTLRLPLDPAPQA